jgi:hypothetical protein
LGNTIPMNGNSSLWAGGSVIVRSLHQCVNGSKTMRSPLLSQKVAVEILSVPGARQRGMLQADRYTLHPEAEAERQKSVTTKPIEPTSPYAKPRVATSKSALTAE